MRLRKTLPYLAIISLVFFLVLLWIGWAWFVIDKFPETGTVSEPALQVAVLRGAFGDMFGGINALFTAILLAGAVYTIWIQQKQIESIREQQIAAERDSNRAAALMATTALVNAKGILLKTRYQMSTDITSTLSSQKLAEEWRPIMEMMAYTNAEKTGTDFKDLDRLATELEEMIDSIKDME